MIDDSGTALDGQLMNNETEQLQSTNDPHTTCNPRLANQQLSKSVTVSNGEKIEITNEKQDLHRKKAAQLRSKIKERIQEK